MNEEEFACSDPNGTVYVYKFNGQNHDYEFDKVVQVK